MNFIHKIDNYSINLLRYLNRQFSFQVPENIPPSVHYRDGKVRIVYFIKIDNAIEQVQICLKVTVIPNYVTINYFLSNFYLIIFN